MKNKYIKCVVWDLDNTIWDGVLVEDNNVTLKKGVKEIIEILDKRGILQSIASKNEYNSTMAKLKEFELEDYFIYPQINWNSKASNIETIRKNINISMDAIAFVDDQEFEREEVLFELKDILCIDAAKLDEILDMQELNPRFVTEDSKLRRKMYQSDIVRNKIEDNFKGTSEEFLASLGMKFTIQSVGDKDLQRAEELTVRTHQLNTTGYTYSYEELDELRKSDKYKVIITGLEDKYGTYGKIGLMVVETDENVWTIKLLLMSCRVMSRGVGTLLLNYLMKLAKEENVILRAEFVATDRNRMMYITYKFAGFKEVGNKDNVSILENDLSFIQETPDYVDLIVNI